MTAKADLFFVAPVYLAWCFRFPPAQEKKASKHATSLAVVLVFCLCFSPPPRLRWWMIGRSIGRSVFSSFDTSSPSPPTCKQQAAAAAASSASSMPAVSSGADIDTDELVDETGVEPKDIELIMSQVSMQEQGTR